MKKVLILIVVVISFLNSSCSTENQEVVSEKNKNAGDVNRLIK
jgi:hypothetical protein